MKGLGKLVLGAKPTCGVDLLSPLFLGPCMVRVLFNWVI